MMNSNTEHWTQMLSYCIMNIGQITGHRDMSIKKREC